MIESNERLQFAACWAHARRYVYEVNKENKHRAMLLDMIQLLYDANAREQGMDAAARTTHRQAASLPVLAAIKKYIDSLNDQVVLPKSDLADALRYLRNHWNALTLYATDGRIPIDNNRVEQLMREVALGRKNWLFVGNVEGGERSARLMSIVSSAKLRSTCIANHLGCSLKTVKRELETLRLAGKIEFIGPSKTGTYQLVGT